jgi:hypothetical protein
VHARRFASQLSYFSASEIERGVLGAHARTAAAARIEIEAGERPLQLLASSVPSVCKRSVDRVVIPGRAHGTMGVDTRRGHVDDQRDGA